MLLSDIETNLDKKCEEYIRYLYRIAYHKYNDADDIDSIIQDTMTAFILKIKQGVLINHPKAYLASILSNKYNDWLRDKYRSEMLIHEDTENVFYPETTDEIELTEEYEYVRREIGRLIKIYRDVTVMHYVKGMNINRISSELGISRGTVLSRLSSARSQIREKLLSMEKYSEISYLPKKLSIGIWGGDGISGEPFSLVRSPIEENLLILSYEKPVSIRDLAETMGMPCAYLEPAIDKLINGELMGRTSGGLVFTRCYMRNYEDSFGDIKKQEAFAEKYAQTIWNTVWENISPLTQRKEFSEMSEKQKATFILFLIMQALQQCIIRCKPDFDDKLKFLPDRPNGGKWLAIATVFENGQKHNSIYDSSGPVEVNYRDQEYGKKMCQMFDFQSVFGDTHWAYGNFRYKVSLVEILRFYASLLPCDVKPANSLINQLIPEFEKLHIVKTDKNGKAVLDIPALSFEEIRVWEPVSVKINDDLYGILNEGLTKIIAEHTNKIPKHVDCREFFRNESTLNAYAIAQLRAIVNNGFLPYTVEIGKTPIIYLAYRKKFDT